MVGVNTAIFTNTGTSAGVGFAIPIDIVRSVVPQLIQYGKVVRPALNIQVTTAASPPSSCYCSNQVLCREPDREGNAQHACSLSYYSICVLSPCFGHGLLTRQIGLRLGPPASIPADWQAEDLSFLLSHSVMVFSVCSCWKLSFLPVAFQAGLSRGHPATPSSLPDAVELSTHLLANGEKPTCPPPSPCTHG